MATTTAADMDTAPAATAAASAATTTATGQSQVLRERGRSGIFLVVDIERPQADVENFLLAEKEFMTL
ncbi:MAG: hypothetical protein WBD90_11575 [Xanthobacteraceae bacterium]